MGTRPTGDPKSRKDFRKVLQKTSDDGEEEKQQTAQNVGEEGDELTAMAEGVADKRKAPPSLFDLTSGKTAKAPSQSREGQEISSPSAVYSRMTTEDPKKAVKGEHAVADTRVYTAPKEEKFTTRFATEQPDLSYVNPMAAATNQPATVSNAAPATSVLPVKNIQEIIDQLVSRVYEIKDTGRTDTTITLKHPPLFAGADIVVTAYDSAKGEFNISFQNLTQAAKNALDMQVNRDSLLLSLEQKGYAVHILSTTTIVENRTIAEARPSEERPGEQRQDTGEGREGRGEQRRG